METALPALIAAVAAVCISIEATAQMTPRETLVFVEHGRPLNVVFSTTPWTTQGGALTGAGNDNWMLADRGIEEGDFHITARLTIRGLARSAARFSFNQQHAFGFEGNHQHVYITNYLTGKLGRREELSMAFSEDDGRTWSEPVVILREKGKRQSYPRLFERRPGELWITVWQGQAFIKLHENDFVTPRQ